MVKKIIVRKRMVKQPRTTVIRRTRMIKIMEMRKKKKQKKTIQMVKRTISKPQLKYVLEQVRRRAVKMVKQIQSTEK